jgi:hypothetical protein
VVAAQFFRADRSRHRDISRSEPGGGDDIIASIDL